MPIKFGVYRLHAVTQQLIYRTFDVAAAELQHLIPEFIDREWIVRNEEEYLKMLAEVEGRVNTHYSEKWARKGGSLSAMETGL